MAVRIKGFALRIFLFDSVTLESAHQFALRHLHAGQQVFRQLGPPFVGPFRHAFQRPRQIVGDRDQVRGEPFDGVGARRLHIAFGALARVFQLRQRPQRAVAQILVLRLQLGQRVIGSVQVAPGARRGFRGLFHRFDVVRRQAGFVFAVFVTHYPASVLQGARCNRSSGSRAHNSGAWDRQPPARRQLFSPGSYREPRPGSNPKD